MIQSGKFDSFNMNIKNIANTVLIFIIRRLIEISGIFVSILGILLLLSLITYSPSDPNFIFPENTKIENLLGYQGSYVSDLFFQSLGLSAFLIPFTYLFTGLNIFKSKDIFLLLENTFFLILCLLVGSLFFNLFYLENFTLHVNGSGGFIGEYFSKMFIWMQSSIEFTCLTMKFDNSHHTTSYI